jgi:hypothetical protein
MSISFTLSEGVGFSINMTPVVFTINGVQVNSGAVMPPVAGNALKYPRVNAAGTAYEPVSIPGGGDMLKSDYDSVGNNIVNEARAVPFGGVSGLPAGFTPASHLHVIADITDFPAIPDQLSDLSEDTTHRVVTDAEKSTWNSKAAGIHSHNLLSLDERSYNSLTDTPDLSIYTLVDGTRKFSGLVGYSGLLTPSDDLDIVHKKYVDDAITAGGGYTDEMAQDAVGGMLDSTLTYTDGTPELKVTNPVTPQATGFTISAGTTSKTLTVPDTASVSGTNTGDNATNSQYSGLDAAKISKSIMLVQSIIAAVSASTPFPLEFAEGTVMGRATGGNVTALSIDIDLSSASANDDTIPSAKATKTALDGKSATDHTHSTYLGKSTNIQSINEAGIADGEIAVFNLTNKDIRTSDKTIVTTLGADDTTVPTSKAVKDVTDALVTKALFDAGTVLYATNDNTPEAKTLAQLRTLLQYINLTETVLTGDGTYIPLVTMSVTVDTNTVGFGGALTYTAADAHYDDANATGATKLCGGIAVETGTGTKIIMVQGQICETSWNWTVFGRFDGRIYLSTTDGQLTQTAPSASGNAVQCIGFALSADTIFVDIDSHFLTRA